MKFKKTYLLIGIVILLVVISVSVPSIQKQVMKINPTNLFNSDKLSLSNEAIAGGVSLPVTSLCFGDISQQEPKHSMFANSPWSTHLIKLPEKSGVKEISQFIDVNGDGLQDYFYKESDVPATDQSYVYDTGITAKECLLLNMGGGKYEVAYSCYRGGSGYYYGTCATKFGSGSAPLTCFSDEAKWPYSETLNPNTSSALLMPVPKAENTPTDSDMGQFTDIDGDGLIDYVYRYMYTDNGTRSTSSYACVLLNNGHGWTRKNYCHVFYNGGSFQNWAVGDCAQQ